LRSFSPPLLSSTPRQITEQATTTGVNPYFELFSRIQNDDPPQDGGELNALVGSQQQENSETEDNHPNDVIVMLANAVKYGLWKASRLEPRKGQGMTSTGEAWSLGNSTTGTHSNDGCSLN